MVTLNVASQQLFPGEVGAVRSVTLDFLGSVPELAGQMDGWEPVGFQLLPQGGNDLHQCVVEAVVESA